MSRETFDQKIAELAADIDDRALDEDLATYLNEAYGPGSEWFRIVTSACRQAVDDGWMCDREAGGIRFGRVTKPGTSAGSFSVDVVSMSNCKGPYHVHPSGEIDLVMPIEGDARFDGQDAGWKVYAPGTAHFPTVTGGAALVLYLLPNGEIEFTRPG